MHGANINMCFLDNISCAGNFQELSSIVIMFILLIKRIRVINKIDSTVSYIFINATAEEEEFYYFLYIVFVPSDLILCQYNENFMS